MKILVTGAAGFVGKNLVENLKNIKNGKNRTHSKIHIDEIFEFDRSNTLDELDDYCRRCDFVFNLAGVNRPKNNDEFLKGNFGFASILLNTLKKNHNTCPVMLSSSIQATLQGRFGNSEYGLSKKAGEELFFTYAQETGAIVYVYRFPNLAGKWIQPNYNSAVGTFCYNIAHDLPIRVDDPQTELELLFIDDLLEEMAAALEENAHHCDYPEKGTVIDGKEYDGLTPYFTSHGKYCGATVTHRATLGHIVDLLQSFHDQPETLIMPAIPEGSLEKKLFSMYLSYLPKEKVAVPLSMHGDSRGSFTELIKTMDHGQISVNISKPGITKGEHWHNSKWEIFIVVFGHGLIQERKIGTDEIIEYEVDGSKLQAVYMLPGYTHNIINLSQTENLVTVMWANEIFDPEHPDTFSEKVEK
ncbi:NAD-dependent epimerase/dehydratase family protein [Megasphaera sp. AM44-1BH]|uniref:polysaccharide biosynthesis C-terminal domain-containing protein n=1 Tax=Megasphaera sp. AM44-1BH TaxID=2292358 RepID=UPI000E50024D|nr:NAD-dependent epimerase/dehydratase family protein [Megasphaera sp. AM44-1BH]RHA09990.1 NAD-dependent epimerase/dehydratase family protein [Megasphaera sp. AM44-1BH]